MAAEKFVRHPQFPLARCSFTEGGYFWKMRIREWAFGMVNLENIAAGIKITSNNPNVVSDHNASGTKAITLTSSAPKKGTVKFFADSTGFTFIHPFDMSPATALNDLRIQVEVLTRRANTPDDISLTKLEGNTVVFNAPDAKAYTMDKTFTFPAKIDNAVAVFNSVPAGINHLVISSHGGVPTEADKKNADKICLFAGGFKSDVFRLDVDNVESIFKTLKGKVAADCVIWFGGCNIGANAKFCGLAAKASGCHVVAPFMPLLNKTFPKGHVDMLDRFSVPKVFNTNGDAIKLNDFCAKQSAFKFVIPV